MFEFNFAISKHKRTNNKSERYKFYFSNFNIIDLRMFYCYINDKYCTRRAVIQLSFWTTEKKNKQFNQITVSTPVPTHLPALHYNRNSVEDKYEISRSNWWCKKVEHANTHEIFRSTYSLSCKKICAMD